jgi:hypothetical protein
MKKLTQEAIHNANKRGMQFHVVSDQPNYLGGEWVGQGLYHTSWNSYQVAKVVASKEVNGKVYNQELKVV